MRRKLSPLLAFALALSTPVAAGASALPSSVASSAGSALTEVGNMKYRKMGFNIYRASLWAPEGSFDRAKPYALQVKYMRELSKETIVQAVVDDVRAQNTVDAQTMEEWEKMLAATLPAVAEGDELVGLCEPGKPSKLFLNGKQIASIEDQRLSDSFFNIWLGKTADPTLRAQLIGQQ